MQPKRTPAQTWALKERVWNLAENSRLSLRQIAKETGVPFGTVQRWCDGVERPAPVVVTAPRFRALNQKLWKAGIPLAERVKVIEQEMNNAA